MKIVSVCDLSRIPEAVRLLKEMGTFVQVGKDRERLLKELPDTQVYFGGAELEINKAALDCAPNLRLIGSPATGRDHLDLHEIAQRNITLFHIAEEYDLLKTLTATTEGAFTLLLALIRNLPAALQDAKQGIWSRDKHTGFQLFEKNLGIIGLGRLGTIAARIGQGFGMHVLATDIQERQMDGVRMVDLDTLLRESDVVMLHVHLTPETTGLMNREAFARMKPSAVLINTSRGKVVDQDALIDALSTGKIAGAGLDVIDGEWQSQEALYHHPLIAYARTHDHLLITPHSSSATVESIYGARLFMARKIVAYIKEQEAGRL